jgi:hypothetical protein
MNPVDARDVCLRNGWRVDDASGIATKDTPTRRDSSAPVVGGMVGVVAEGLSQLSKVAQHVVHLERT